MTEYTPDAWLVIDCKTHYRILGTWSGGYLDGDSWRLNSGVEEVIISNDYYLFKGYSGSIYKCHKNGRGLVGAYNSYILTQLEEKGCSVVGEMTPEELLEFDWNKEKSNGNSE